MKKYWIYPQVSGFVIWKLNKKNDAFLDKEYMSDNEVLTLLSRIVTHLTLKMGKDGITIKSWWKIEFEIVFPKEEQKTEQSERTQCQTNPL